MLKPNIRVGKNVISVADSCINVGVRRAGLSISETDALPGFSHATISKEFEQNCEKN